MSNDCRCHHGQESHDEHGRCQSGDDDGDGYFDQCYCEKYKEQPPMPPSICINVDAGVYTEVTLPDGTIYPLGTTIVMGSAGSILIPRELAKRKL